MQTKPAQQFEKYTDPETFRRILPMDSVSELWARCLAESPDAPALTYDGITLTYAEAERELARIRPLVGKGKTGILLGNSAAFVLYFLAITTAGGCAVLFPAHFDGETVMKYCALYGIDRLLTAPDGAVASALRASLPSLRLLSPTDRAEESAAASTVDGSAPAAVFFTGGVSGIEKGALLSNRAILRGTVNGCYGYREVFGLKYLLILPLTHVFGMIRNTLTCFYTMGHLIVCKGRMSMFREIAAYNPNLFVFVPALAEMALRLSEKFGKNMLGSEAKYMICGGAAVPPFLVGEFARRGVTVFPGYGLTEAANLVSGNPESLSHPDSAGLLFPMQEYKTVGGELWLRGVNLMDGYLACDEASFTEDGWLRTGDLVRIDEDGFLYITGRTKEIIILPGGENISPAEVEAKFNASPYIEACQVFEDKNEQGKPLLALEVLPRFSEIDKTGAADKETFVIDKIKEINCTLPTYMQINRILLRKTDFERTPDMKIKRYGKSSAGV